MDFVSTNQKLRKALSVERKPLMLRDYLSDDLSSCSSNGFKSFPRRQCCITARFLLEIDLQRTKQGKKMNTKRLLQRSPSKPAASKPISALQRASEALLHAVKQLPFHSVKFPSSSVQVQQNRSEKRRLFVLPRSLSRKLLKRSFWRKADQQRWKTFRECLEEQSQPCDQSKSHSYSWFESEFTADVLRSTSGKSESSSEHGTVESNKTEKNLVNHQVGASALNSEESIKDWRNEEDKEQFSPVSVLDCPFEVDNHINSPPFEHRLARMEGTKQKLMQKLRRFESLAQLEPVDLEKRIASLELDNETKNNTFDEDEANETKNKARQLLQIVKSTTPSPCTSNTSFNILSDFFLEKIIENKQQKVELLIKDAQDWIHGQPKELLEGWEVQDGRKAYVYDMEKNERWGNIVSEEKEEVGFALDLEVFTCLINELVLELSTDSI